MALEKAVTLQLYATSNPQMTLLPRGDFVSFKIPKFVFYGELSYGKRSIGAPRRRYKDQLKQQLACAGIDHRNWQTLLSVRKSGWRPLTKRAVQNFEERRVRAAQERRRRRKEPTTQTSSTCDHDQVFPCPNCSKPESLPHPDRTLSPVIFGLDESAIIAPFSDLFSWRRKELGKSEKRYLGKS